MNPNPEIPLSVSLRNMTPGSEPLSTELRTSQRVLARVTDGIYRQPGSALRELISNAYDADATRVTITTDRPRFERITISDDGIGMTPEVLEHLLHNIGGSAKRTSIGVELAVTDPENPNLSRGGRQLIGKIGIGLFSVAQLTQSFQISTKVAGDKFQSVAQVLLRQFSDSTVEIDDEGQYKAGSVLLWRVGAEDEANQGTTITLTSVRPQTQQALRSDDLWQRIQAASEGLRGKMQPLFHVGLVAGQGFDRQRLVNNEHQHLPWSPGDDCAEAFREFVTAPKQALDAGRQNAQLENILDDYLRMVWNLGLASPLPYVAGHPFDVDGDADLNCFLLTGRGGDEALAIPLEEKQALREVVPFDLPCDPTGFEVRVDELCLSRPITLAPPPKTNAALQTPIFGVGHYRSEFPKRDRELSGGPLEFSAYLYWTPRLLPPEHSGVLIRVNEASGTLFDPKFLGFPANEERRMSQTSCEVFIHEGFDGALNIDRESFNQTHPHAITITRWVHGSLRQVIATQKRLGSSANKTKRKRAADVASAKVQSIVDDVWEELDLDGEPPPVYIGDADGDSLPGDGYVWPDSVIGEVTGPNWPARLAQREEMASALTQILDAYDVWNRLDPARHDGLIKALYDVVAVYLK